MSCPRFGLLATKASAAARSGFAPARDAELMRWTFAAAGWSVFYGSLAIAVATGCWVVSVMKGPPRHADRLADLLEVEGMDDTLAAELARHGIVTREDLAEQAIDDLVEIPPRRQRQAAEDAPPAAQRRDGHRRRVAAAAGCADQNHRSE